MNVTYSCPQCEKTTLSTFRPGSDRVKCLHCESEVDVAGNALEGDRLKQCLVCPNGELYVRKDFPQHWGIAIVVVGIVGSSFCWFMHWIYATYGVLFATALADLLLFMCVENQLKCYRCGAEYRGISELEGHQPFELETHERYRQQLARMSPNPPGKT
ncbi:MAG: hypothetical protein WEE51_13235 [Pirellulaceae bacterium]